MKDVQVLRRPPVEVSQGECRTAYQTDASNLTRIANQPGSDESVAAAAERVAYKHGWDAKWLNFEVTKADAIPTLGRVVEWETISDEDGIVIDVVSKKRCWL